MRTLRSALILAVVVVLAVLSIGGMAAAQDSPPGTTDPPGSTTIPGGSTTVPGGGTTTPGGTTIPGGTTQATPTTAARGEDPRGDNLPRTGEDILPAVVLGIAMVGVGVLLLMRVRQRLHHPFAV